MGAAATATGLPAGVLHRLAARDAARHARAAERAQSNGTQQSPAESVKLFWEDFDTRQAAISAGLDALAASHGPVETQSELAHISTDLAAADQVVAQSAYFLPPYDLRKADTAVKALRQRLVEVGPAAAPQRRAFGFSKAVKRTSALQAADDASATVPTVPTSTDEQRPPCRIADGDALHHGARDGQNGALSATSDGLRPQEAAPGRCLKGLTGQQVVLHGDSLGGGDFGLADLTDCSLWLLGRLSALRMERLLRCNVYGGPICGATFIEGAEDCTFMLASHQVRIHAARGCDFYLRLRSNPIIEDCSQLGFAPCPADLPVPPEQLVSAGLAEETGLWAEVQDFLWLRSAPSPNWRVIADAARLLAAVPPGQADQHSGC